MATTLPRMTPPADDPAIIAPQPGPQTAFLASPADFVIYGGQAGGGKTWGLMLDPLRNIGKPAFRSVIFRRVAPQITNPGGLWDESSALYPLIGGVPNRSRLEWVFPAGARIKFGHMQYEDDKLEWQGAQVAHVGWDELTHFSEGQVFYLLTRQRSIAGIRSSMRGGCNPDADSWVASFIAWWIDQETGYAIPQRSGVIRWFVRDGDTIVWADTKHELLRDYPHLLPISFTFIPATVYDNKKLLAKDPGYIARLMAQPRVERERLLGGNWKVVASPRDYFKREWFPIVDAAPAEVAGRERRWDFAATEPSKRNADPDYTCGALVSRTRQGVYHIEDIRRVRASPASVEALVLQTAQLDGRGVPIYIEQEPGSAGKQTIATYTRLLAGYDVHGERSTGPKEEFIKPFSAQCEAGNVRLVRGEWIGAFLDEAEAWPMGAHDDQLDPIGRAVVHLAEDDLPYAYRRHDPAYRAQVLGAATEETDDERQARRLAEYLQAHSA